MKAFLIAAILSVTTSAVASGRDIAGRFDYYVLSLSWQPTWCRDTGDARHSPQCDADGRSDFTVHGLWPQDERGWPEDCATRERDPSRAESAAMADVMGSGGLAWYQWQKHGRCAGIPAADYYAAIRKAADIIIIPQVFRDLARDLNVPPPVIEDAFIEVNPTLSRDAITIICKGRALQEVRICLTRDLEPRDCAPDSRRDCPHPDVAMESAR